MGGIAAFNKLMGYKERPRDAEDIASYVVDVPFGWRFPVTFKAVKERIGFPASDQRIQNYLYRVQIKQDNAALIGGLGIGRADGQSGQQIATLIVATVLYYARLGQACWSAQDFVGFIKGSQVPMPSAAYWVSRYGEAVDMWRFCRDNGMSRAELDSACEHYGMIEPDINLTQRWVLLRGEWIHIDEKRRRGG